MKLVLNTAYGISILLYNENNKLIYTLQDLDITADDVFDTLKASNIEFSKLNYIVLIDGPGSQIGMKVGEVCLKPILLIYEHIKLVKFSYFEAMMVYYLTKSNILQSGDINNKGKVKINDLVLNEIILAISVTSTRFYCSHIINDDIFNNLNNKDSGAYKSIKIIDDLFDLKFYYKNDSYIKLDIDQLLFNNKNLVIAGHKIFNDHNNYIKNDFPLSLKQLELIMNKVLINKYLQ